MWKFEGQVHRLDSPDLVILVFEHADPPIFTLAADVEVHASGKRYSGTFMTPEQVRECLTKWTNTGESLPGNAFGHMPDLVLVGELSLSNIERVVQHFVGEGIEQSPLQPMRGEV